MFSIQSTSQGVWADSAALVKMQHCTVQFFFFFFFLPLPRVQPVTHSRGHLAQLMTVYWHFFVMHNTQHNWLFFSNLPACFPSNNHSASTGWQNQGDHSAQHVFIKFFLFFFFFNSVSQQKSGWILLKWHPNAKTYSTAFCLLPISLHMKQHHAHTQK